MAVNTARNTSSVRPEEPAPGTIRAVAALLRRRLEGQTAELGLIAFEPPALGSSMTAFQGERFLRCGNSIEKLMTPFDQA